MMIALVKEIIVPFRYVIVHTQVTGPDASSPVFFPNWLPIILVGLLLAMSAMVIRYRTAYLLKKNEEMKLYRQTQFQGQMLAVINHDIQTPLHYLERSLEQVDNYIQAKADDQVIRDTSDVAYHAVRHIRKFTGDLLVFVKMQLRDHNENPTIEPVKVSQLADVTLDFFVPTIQSKGLIVRNEIPAELTVNTNGSLFSVILHNLVDNALKNTIEGQVVISSTETRDEINIIVADTGSGMKQETADWINTELAPSQHFDESGAPGGSGIGLVIIKEFCLTLGIRLQVEPAADKGTKAVLSFSK